MDLQCLDIHLIFITDQEKKEDQTFFLKNRRTLNKYILFIEQQKKSPQKIWSKDLVHEKKFSVIESYIYIKLHLLTLYSYYYISI